MARRFRLRLKGKKYRHYTSTYCQHGACSRCRLACKTCFEPCRHKCHEET